MTMQPAQQFESPPTSIVTAPPYQRALFVRQVGRADFAEYKALVRRGALEEPAAFHSLHHEQVLGGREASVLAVPSGSLQLLAHNEAGVVGIISAFRNTAKFETHKLHLGSLYVVPEARNSDDVTPHAASISVGKKLLSSLLARLPDTTAEELWVTVPDMYFAKMEPWLRLLGFELMCERPETLRIDGTRVGVVDFRYEIPRHQL